MFETLLVPLDGSELAEETLSCAQALAKRLASEIQLISVCEPPGEQERLLQVYLEKVTGRLSAQGLKVRSELLYGKAADEILNYAAKNKSGLIIMATHGRSGLTRWAMGSVVSKVLGAATNPMLLVRSGCCKVIPPDGPPFNRILVTLDGSPGGSGALPYVEELAAKTGAGVYLMHVVQIPLTLASDSASFVDTVSMSKLVEALEKEGKDYLARAASGLQSRGIVTSSMVKIGPVAETILDFAHGSLNVDLIAMSTHGRGGISRWVFGSIAAKVLQSAQLPVLIVRVRTKKTA